MQPLKSIQFRADYKLKKMTNGKLFILFLSTVCLVSGSSDSSENEISSSSESSDSSEEIISISVESSEESFSTTTERDQVNIQKDAISFHFRDCLFINWILNSIEFAREENMIIRILELDGLHDISKHLV